MENLEPEWEGEDEEKAPSLADLPLSYDHSSREYLLLQKKRPWKNVLKVCRAPRTSNGHDFEFSSPNCTPKLEKNQFSDEFCPADKLFYKGQLLPFSSHLRDEYSSDSSVPKRQDSQSSNSSSGSTSQSSNGGSTSAPTGISRVSSNQRRSSWQYIARGLLSSPETPWSSTTTLRSQYSSSASGKPSVSFSEDCQNPKTRVSFSQDSQNPNEKSRVSISQDCRNPKTEKEFPSVKRREKSRNGWLTSIISYGNGCRNSCGVVTGAHRRKPKESNSQIGRYNAVKE